ncbi:MAG: ATP-binding cassette domain-containing protein [Ardenticatenaceae bacterium]|nr:ATP-binding cassette domain-containing protein [Ardenticatenaceae bacterium]MCB8949236.1 ATP-binding cassette domain-containing protein [Ardenticatenaceae bacterium]
MTDPIKLTNLARQFERGGMDVQALRGVDLAIEPGEFVALVGPSGSGKSTLLNLLGGLDRPSTGELWLNGTALHTATEAERTLHRRQRIGFIFQSFNLLPRLTAVENVAIPLMLSGVSLAEREARAKALLEKVGLGHRLDHYPTELSGGEQQRTAVARALIHNPSLILADEPTGNLDSKTGEEVMALLKELNREQGITLIVVTHDDEVAAYADRIVKLRDGHIVEEIKAPSPQPSPSRERELLFPPPTRGRAREGVGVGLQFSDIIRQALSNLRRRPVRNVLTAGGVLIGIVTLVAMVSFGVGVQREVQRNFESIGLENLFVRPVYNEPDAFDPFAAPSPQTPITPELVAQIEQLPDVVSVTPELGLPFGIDIALAYGDTSLPIRIADSEERQFSFGGQTDPVAGVELGDQGNDGVVLVRGLADSLLADGQTYDDLLGQNLSLIVQLPRGETETFPSEIIGVRDSFSSSAIDLGLAEREAILAWWYNEPNILQTEGYNGLTVQTTDLGAITAVSIQIEELGLQTQSLEAILNVANQVLGLMQALLGSVGGLALLVAALGVANTMMMAIYERTREIGVLKALGASAGEIRALFTVEAAMLGLLGGFFGLIFGTLLGRLVDWIGHRFLIAEGITGIGQLSVVPPWLALGSLAFAAFIGIVAGLYPAARAARLDPVAALRHE